MKNLHFREVVSGIHKMAVFIHEIVFRGVGFGLRVARYTLAASNV